VIDKAFVIDVEGKALLPTHPARARKLLRDGKAIVEQVAPFVIRLKRTIAKPVGEFTVGIDDGAKTVGIAVVNEATEEAVFMGEIRLRQDVSRKMTERAMHRRTRRSRKTRSRRNKGKDRTHLPGWLPPTIRQKKESVVRVVSDLQRYLNITRCVVEQGEFDTSSLVAGEKLFGVAYQIPRYEGRDFRAKVLWRDEHTCQRCGSQDNLQAHHIQYRINGGTDTVENGITLCQTCHKQLHKGEWKVTKQPQHFKYPAHLQQGKWYLWWQLKALGLNMECCVGWMTRYWRNEIGLDKSHINDAIAMVCRQSKPTISAKEHLVIPKRKKVWENNPTKTCTEKNGFCIGQRHSETGKTVTLRQC